MSNYSLEIVEFSITNACSHKCPFCYADGGMVNVAHANIEKLMMIIDILSESNVKEVILLGGDPVNHPHIIELIDYIYTRSIRVSIMSNTLEFIVKDITSLARKMHSIQATVHSSRASAHDDFCGVIGAYKNIVDKLRMYSDLGVKVNIAINITPLTYNHLYEIVYELATRYGISISSIFTQRILPFGRGQTCGKDYSVTSEQLNIALEQIAHIDRDFAIDISIEDPYPFCCFAEKYRRYMKGCPEGRSRIAMNGDGSVSKCGALPDYSLGNVFDTPLLDIWNKSDELSRFREMSYLNAECKKCRFRNECGGGCPIDCEMCNKAGKHYDEAFRNREKDYEYSSDASSQA